MFSGGPKGENVQVDMDSKGGDLFSAEDAHPTGTGGTGVLSRYELQSFYFFSCANHHTMFILMLIYRKLSKLHNPHILCQHLSTPFHMSMIHYLVLLF